MKLHEIKVGQKLQHYCCGQIVNAKVINTNGREIQTEHPPVIWAGQTYTRTWILPSTFLQRPYSQTTPSAWIDGKPIQSDHIIDSFIFSGPQKKV